jgi:hypothetical protein
MATQAIGTTRVAVRADAGNETSRSRDCITDPISNLLSRLDRVRQAGRGWTAKCPSHEDRTASLSITGGEDGRVLIHCFAGCGAADVVSAAGLSVADLFVRRPSRDMTFAERAALREHGRQAGWRAALNVLAVESKIVQIIARDVAIGVRPTTAHIDRLIQACDRIDAVQEALYGRAA